MVDTCYDTTALDLRPSLSNVNEFELGSCFVCEEIIDEQFRQVIMMVPRKKRNRVN